MLTIIFLLLVISGTALLVVPGLFVGQTALGIVLLSLGALLVIVSFIIFAVAASVISKSRR